MPGNDHLPEQLADISETELIPEAQWNRAEDGVCWKLRVIELVSA